MCSRGPVCLIRPLRAKGTDREVCVSSGGWRMSLSHTRIHTYTQTHIYTHIQTRTHRPRHTYIHASTQTYIHTYTHTHYPHTHTCRQTLTHPPVRRFFTNAVINTEALFFFLQQTCFLWELRRRQKHDFLQNQTNPVFTCSRV